jgi:polyhydroxyalkanoate synthesis regulator phasin
VDSAWQRYMEVVSGFTQLTQRSAEQVVRVLVRRGEVEASRGERTVEGLLARVDQNRKAVASIVRSEIEDAVRRMGLARQSDIDRLQARIARLEVEVRRQQPAEKTATRKSAVKKSTAKATGKKAAAKKATAKKAAASRATAAAAKSVEAPPPRPVSDEPAADVLDQDGGQS